MKIYSDNVRSNVLLYTLKVNFSTIEVKTVSGFHVCRNHLVIVTSYSAIKETRFQYCRSGSECFGHNDVSHSKSMGWIYMTINLRFESIICEMEISVAGISRALISSSKRNNAGHLSRGGEYWLDMYNFDLESNPTFLRRKGGT